MKRLFVGNLAWKASEELLRPLFEAYGTVVSIRIVTDQLSGKSRGFAFVEMENAESAQRAIQELDNKPFLERNLRVSLANERTEGSKGGAGGGRGPRGGDRDRGPRGGGGGGYRQGNRSERSFNSDDYQG